MRPRRGGDRTPRFARLLLGFCVPGPAGLALLGDLEEEFVARTGTGDGLAAARMWYWGQAARSLWPGLTLHVRWRSCGRLLGAITLGIVILWLAGELAMRLSLTGLRAVWPGEQAPPSLSEVAYVLGLTPAAFLAGYVAAWHGRHNGPLAAVSLAAIVTVPLIIVTVTGMWTPPYWSHAVVLATGPVGVVLGAGRYARRFPVT